MHYYTHNIGEFAVETRFLSPEDIGVYVILKDEYFSTGMRLVCDRIAELMPPECEASLKKVLARFFTLEDGFYVRAQWEKELAGFKDKGAINSENAKKRWAKRREATESQAKESDSVATVCDSHANRTSSHAKSCLTNNQKPITNNQRIESTDVLSAQAQAPASTPVRRRKRPSSACPFAADAVIPADYLEVAQATGVGNPQACFGKFVNHALANDRRLVDWKAGFRTWCANELQYHPNQQTVRKPLSQRTAADYADWLS